MGFLKPCHPSLGRSSFLTCSTLDRKSITLNSDALLECGWLHPCHYSTRAPTPLFFFLGTVSHSKPLRTKSWLQSHTANQKRSHFILWRCPRQLMSTLSMAPRRGISVANASKTCPNVISRPSSSNITRPTFWRPPLAFQPTQISGGIFSKTRSLLKPSVAARMLNHGMLP